MADIGDVSQKAFFLNGGKGHAAHRNGSGISSVSSHQDRSQCGFTAAAFSHQRRKAALREGKINAMEDLPVRLIGEGETGTADCMIRRETFSNLKLCFFPIQQTENLVAGRHAVHGNMEKGTQLPHGNKEIRRQQDNQQTSLKRNSSALVLGHRHDDAQRCAAVSDQVHNGDGV